MLAIDTPRFSATSLGDIPVSNSCLPALILPSVISRLCPPIRPAPLAIASPALVLSN